MHKPIIGITSDTNYIKRNDEYSGLEVNYSQKVFSDAVFAAGGLPYMIPMNGGDYADELMEVLDGLIIIGGHDVSPLVYGQEPRAKLGMTRPDRDASDLALFEEAKKRRVPVLGVCRGLQLINAAQGGTLYQDLSEDERIQVQHDQLAKPDQLVHAIFVQPGTNLSRIISDGEIVNSIHHQVIDQLGEGLTVSALSNDGVIEAMESQEKIPLIMAVQWHPETIFQDYPQHLKIFEDLIYRAEAYRY